MYYLYLSLALLFVYKSEAKVIKVVTTGDIIPHTNVQKMLYSGKFSKITAEVKDIISESDISFANLETPVAHGITVDREIVSVKVPPRFDKLVYTGYPAFNVDAIIIDELQLLGFNALLAANNHSLDRGRIGIDKTIKSYEAKGINPIGISKKGEPKNWYTIVEGKNANNPTKVAFVGCTYGTNFPTISPQIVYCFDDKPMILLTIVELSTRKDIDAIIFTPHWGVEYSTQPTTEQELMAYEILNAGAVAVIGTHPHVLQRQEIFKTNDGRNTLIEFSLGNFISTQVGLERQTSRITTFDIIKNDNGVASIENVQVVNIISKLTRGKVVLHKK